MKKFGFILIVFFLLFLSTSKAQYISTSETVPFVCPSVCAGGVLVLKIFQLQNLTVGAQVQAVLSNPTGGFGSGTTSISCNRYSLVSINGPWIVGAYTFTGNVSNVFFEFTIPSTAVPAAGYTVRFVSGATTGANMQMPCTGFTITPSYVPLAAVVPSTSATNQWIAHAYTWTSTTGALLNTSALIAAQDFFNPTNYKGHFLKNTLNFDINYTPNGGKMPGGFGVLHDGTSFQCGAGYTNNFSLRFYRTENYAPGLYRLEIQGDDGIRLSIDGGLTWILDSFIEQSYAGSYKSTTTLFPNGICLSGNVPLVIEYFQRPADSRITFTSTLLSPNTLNQPSDTVICAGQNATFSVNAIVGASYQWQVSTNGGSSFSPLTNTAPYSGVTTNQLQLTAAGNSLNTNLYNCVVTGLCTNPIQTSNALLSVTTSAPSITSQPQNINVCNLGTATFTVNTTGTALYQWQIDSSGIYVNLHNGGAYSNVNTSVLTISPVTTGMNNFNYQCLVTGCGISVPTTIATLFVSPNAVLLNQPQNSTICAGNNTTFSVTASNALSYQWQENSGAGFVNLSNGGVYSNVTSSILSISGATAAMNGNQYQCIVTGCGPGINSTSGLLTVGVPASISSQPLNVSLCIGSPGTFSLNSVIGLTYQWQVNTGSGFSNVSNGLVYAGATTPTLQLVSMQAGMDGYTYQCIVSGCGSTTVTSTIAVLSLGTTAFINSQPQALQICGSGNTSFTVLASNVQTYQWQVNNGSGFVPLSNNATYSNVAGATLNISGAGANLSGSSYQCVLSSCSGITVLSNAVALVVTPLATITTQPVNQTICVGGTASFNFAATGALSYTWNGGYGGSLTPLSNGSGIVINGSNISFSNVGLSLNNYQLNCTLTDCAGIQTTSTVTLSVTPSVTITSASGNQSGCEGDNFTFSVNANAATTYQWQANSGSGFVNLSNGAVYSTVASATLSISAASTLLNGTQYQCLVLGCGNSNALSVPASLSLLPVATLTSQTPSAVICVGSATALSITTSFPANSYQWQVNSGFGFVNLSDGGIYSGSATPLLSISSASSAENGNSYQCVFTSCGPSKTSLPIPFTVQSLPLITEHPNNEKKCEGEIAFLNTKASGQNLSYMWQISMDGGLSFSDLNNSIPYSNVTSPTLQINPVSADMKNYFFRCEVEGCSQSVYSNPASIDASENATTVFVPNAFSPNNDGLNDFFELNPYGLKSVKGELFNRWGELIFEWNSLNTQWDGKKNGTVVPDGVYVYKIEAGSNCGEEKLLKKGTISVIK